MTSQQIEILRKEVESMAASGASRSEDADVVGELAEGLEVIERNTRVQTQLIDDLLEMSRTQAARDARQRHLSGDCVPHMARCEGDGISRTFGLKR